MAKLLSVIVPSYNMENYLHKCLGSFGVEQLMERMGSDGEPLAEKLEVIVVNDGSKDRTSEIAHEFEHKFPTVYRVIDKANGHHGSCVNAALKVVTGTYVRILDADDAFAKPEFAEFMEYLDRLQTKHPGEVDLVFSGVAMVDPDDNVTSTECFSFPTECIFTLSEIVDRELFQALSMVTYRTEIVRHVGYHQPEGVMYSDNIWTFAPLPAINRCAHFKKVLYRYLWGRPGQSMDSAVWARNTHQMVTVFKAMMDCFNTAKPTLQPCNRKAMEKALLNIGQIIYGMLFYHVPRKQAEQLFAEVDARVKEVSSVVYADLGSSAAFTKFHPFKYVEHCRRYPQSFGRVTRVIRIYKSLGRFAKRLIGRS